MKARNFEPRNTRNTRTMTELFNCESTEPAEGESGIFYRDTREVRE
jgi:hypothetical protein